MQARRVEVSLFFSGLALLMAFFCLMVQELAYQRTPWAGDHLAILRLANMACALCWIQCWSSFGTRLAGLGAYSAPVNFLSVVSLLFLPIILLADPRLLSVSWLNDAVYAGINFSSLILVLRHIAWRRICSALFISGLVAFSFGFAILAKGYVSPVSYQLALVHEVHKDALFHAAMTNMIRDFGVISLGLDGLVGMNYHALNHRLSASISLWLGLPALTTLHLAFLIVLFPAFLHALATAALSLRGFKWGHYSMTVGTALLLCWPLAFLLFANTSYLASETYVLSLVVYLSALPMVFSLLRKTVVDRHTLALCITLALAIWIASQAKISTGLNLAAGTGFAYLIAGHSTWRQVPGRLLAALLFAGTPFVIVFLDDFGVVSGISAFGPFHLLLSYTRRTIIYGLTIVATGLVLFHFLRTNRCLWRPLITLFVFAASAFSTSMLFKIPAGSALYFVAPSQWTCFIILAVTLKQPSRLTVVRESWKIALVALLIVVLSIADLNRWRVIADQATTARQLRTLRQDAWTIRAIRSAVDVQQSFGTDFIVRISPTFTRYWKAHPVCWANAFWVPAITARPMLQGLPGQASECTPIIGYGLDFYPQTSRQNYADDNELCMQARMHGFGRILEISATGDRHLVCQAQ